MLYFRPFVVDKPFAPKHYLLVTNDHLPENNDKVGIKTINIATNMMDISYTMVSDHFFCMVCSLCLYPYQREDKDEMPIERDREIKDFTLHK